MSRNVLLAGALAALAVTFALPAGSQTAPKTAPAPKPAAGGVRVAVGDVNGDGHARAAHDAFLKIDTLKGESKDDKHPDWIEIQSFSTGAVDMSACKGSAGPGSITVKGSLPTRPSGELKSPTAVLESVDPLTDGVLIVRYLSGITVPPATAGGRPSETMTLNYTKVSWTRAPCKAGAATGR